MSTTTMEIHSNSMMRNHLHRVCSMWAMLWRLWALICEYRLSTTTLWIRVDAYVTVIEALETHPYYIWEMMEKNVFLWFFWNSHRRFYGCNLIHYNTESHATKTKNIVTRFQCKMLCDASTLIDLNWGHFTRSSVWMYRMWVCVCVVRQSQRTWLKKCRAQ